MEFTSKQIINFATIIIVFTLLVYHLFIWIGRREEIYNLFFSLTGIFCIGQIFINGILNRNTMLLSAIEDLLIFLIILFAVLTIYNLIQFPEIHKTIMKVCLIALLINAIFSFISIKFGESFFQKYTDKISLINCALFGMTTIIVTIFYLLTKKIEIISLLTSIALLVYGLNATITGIIAGTHNEKLQFFSYNYILVAIFFLILAFALSQKFNSEYKELNTLKDTLEEKIELRTIELQHEKESKTNFFINLAHETKTPLTLIQNYLQMYIDEQKGDDKKLRIIKTNIDRLTDDMVNFLDSEKLQRGQELYTNDKIFNLSDMLTNEIILFTETALKKNTTIHNHIEKDIIIKANDIAIDRVIRNLLDNAIKYTDENGEISVSLNSINGKIKLIISDTGTGIPQEHLDNIFKPYYQITREKQNSYGIGMGLFIVKKIIDSINGDIKIDSVEGQGTTIKISLNEHHLKVTENIDNYKINGKPQDIVVFDLEEEKINPDFQNILIVEDEKGIIALLHEQLKNEYNLFYALNGEEALDKLKKININLIISDVMMNKMDGYDFLKNLPEEYKDISFIFLTAKTNINSKLKGIKLGAIDYIYKPFSTEEVKEKIKLHLAKNEKIKEKVFSEIKGFIQKESQREIKKSFEEFCIKYNTSPTEKKILHIIFKNKPKDLLYKEIAYKLKVKENTIKTHISHIFQKTGTTSKYELLKILEDIEV